jgi:inner membrane protein
VDVIDVYSLVDRSVKYGILIIFLTFIVLFVVEILTNVRIHVLQYVMTGSALVVFFLLLLALSEHIAFGLSYLVGAAACVALITFYMFYTLKSIKSTALFSVFLTVLYLVLYMLLNMGDYALLIGSLLIFAILATVMVITRKLDWYEVKG